MAVMARIRAVTRAVSAVGQLSLLWKAMRTDRGGPTGERWMSSCPPLTMSFKYLWSKAFSTVFMFVAVKYHLSFSSSINHVPHPPCVCCPVVEPLSPSRSLSIVVYIKSFLIID